jgi:integrase/recombinase XerD
MGSHSDHIFAVSELISSHRRWMTAASLSPRTIRARVRLLRALHDALPFGLAYASTDELEGWLGNEVWSDWTRRTYANHIRAFYAWANGRYLAGDPAADLIRPRRPKSVPRPVSDDQLAVALESAEPWRTAITLAAYGGLRLSELAGVHREDVTEETIHIREAKGGDAQSVDTHPKVWALVRDRPPGPLLWRPNGRRATAGWFSDNERAYFDSIGLHEVTMHRFRHWFGTMLLNAGADLRVVQEAMRHQSVASTEGYTKVAGGQRRLAIRSLPTPTRLPDEKLGK